MTSIDMDTIIPRANKGMAPLIEAIVIGWCGILGATMLKM